MIEAAGRATVLQDYRLGAFGFGKYVADVVIGIRSGIGPGGIGEPV